jgi:hypothetical protein
MQTLRMTIIIMMLSGCVCTLTLFISSRRFATSLLEQESWTELIDDLRAELPREITTNGNISIISRDQGDRGIDGQGMILDYNEHVAPYNLKNPNGKDNSGYWSQCGQDAVIDSLFQGRRGLFFIESGGFDGEAMSNSLFFEIHRG